MNSARDGKVQGPVLAVVAVAILAAVAGLFFLGPDPAPPDDPDAGIGAVAAGQPDPGRFDPGAGPSRAEPPDQPTRTESRPPVSAGPAARSGASVLGRVVDERGKPVPGALVLLSERWQFGAAPVAQPVTEDPRFTRVTDSSGRYEFDGLAAGLEMNVWVNHRDYSPCLGPPFSARDEVQELPPIVLESGAMVLGRTVDQGDNPVPARVELVYQDSGVLREGTFAEQREQDLRLGRLKVVESDFDGRFEFRHVGASTIWALRASAEGYASAEIMPVQPKPEREAEPLKLVLGTEHVIVGVVLSDERQPLGGAQITASRTKPRPVFTVQGVSEADGSFALRGLPEGVYGLAAVADGYAYGSVRQIEVDAPPIEVMLSRKGGVSGRVTGADGAGLTRFRLELLRTRTNTAQYAQTGLGWDLESPDGSYLIEGLDAGSYVLLARADGACPTYSPGFHVGRDVLLGIDVAMLDGGRVVGRVLGAQGEPLAGAIVSLHGPDYQPPAGNGFFGLDPGDPANVPESRAVSGADGSFEIANAYPGSLKLYVRHATHLARLAPIEVAEGATAQAGDIRLSAGGAVFGVAIDHAGAPLSGGTVSLTRQDGAELYHDSALLDARGRFRFDGLSAGTYEVFAFPNVGDVLWFPSDDAVQTVYVTEGQAIEVRLRAPKP